MAEDNKKQLGYSPEIEYTENYESKIATDSNKIGAYNLPGLDTNFKDPTVPQYDSSFGDHIDDLMNDVAELTTCLPDRLHVIVNQVFKPIYKDWKENIKGSTYPTYIPDPDDVIFIPNPGTAPKPNTGGDNNKNPNNGDDGYGKTDYGDEEYPENIDIYPDNNDDYPEDEEEEKPESIFDDIYKDIVDETDDIDIPIDVQFPTIDKLETIKLEYLKNIMELYEFFVSQLKDTLSSYFFQMINALVGTTTTDQMIFLFGNITEDKALDTADDDERTLMDASLKSEVIGNLKLDFLENTFKIESTLYHMKTFKASNELRQRYYSYDKNSDEGKTASTSAKVQQAMQIMYDRKYEDAYINYYKYLNSALRVMDDALKELETGFKTKSTINNK